MTLLFREATVPSNGMNKKSSLYVLSSAIYFFFWSYGSGDPQRHHFGRTECYRGVSWTKCISLAFDTLNNTTNNSSVNNTTNKYFDTWLG